MILGGWDKIKDLAGLTSSEGAIERVELEISQDLCERLRTKAARLHIGVRPWTGRKAKFSIVDFHGVMRIDFLEPGGTISIGRCGRIQSSIACYRDVTVSIGDGTTINGAMFSVMASRIVIGSDCMLAGEIAFQSNDQHAVFQMHDLAKCNIKNDIVVGDHVWIGLRSTMLPGARVGQGSIIGAGSVVTGLIPEWSLAAGVPCRVLRSDVSWSRSIATPDKGTLLMQSRWRERLEHGKRT